MGCQKLIEDCVVLRQASRASQGMRLVLEAVRAEIAQTWCAEHSVESLQYAWQTFNKLAGAGETEQVLLFILARGPIDSQDAQGLTALMWAAFSNQLEIVTCLLNAGANPDLQTYVNFDPKDPSLPYGTVAGFSALMYAAYEGHTEIVLELIKAAAALDLRDTKLNTALMAAISQGSRHSIYQKDGTLWGDTPNNHAEIAVALIEAGANVNLRNDSNRSALFLGSLYSPGAHHDSRASCVIVEALVQNGAELDASESRGMTPLMRACRCGFTAIVETLIRAGAAIDLQDEEGRTALIIAIYEEPVQITRALIEAGADVTVADYHGYTPLAYAVYKRGNLGISSDASAQATLDEMIVLLEEATSV